MKRLLLLLLAVCSVGARPPSRVMAVGVVADTSVDSHHFSGSAGGSFVNGNPVSIYVVWYNNISAPWSSTQMTLTQDLLNHLSSLSWYSGAVEYPNTSGQTVPSFSFVSSTSDPENEGTTGNWDSLALAAAINNGFLPYSTQALYIVLPSTTDCVLGANIAGQHFGFSTTFGSASGISGIRINPASRVLIPGPGPNGDDTYDGLMEVVSHEIMESVTAGWGGVGEVADFCSGGGSGVFAAAGGFATATFIGTGGATRYFVLADYWIRSQGGYCYQGEQSAFLTIPCLRNSDCPAFSAHCANYYCQTPTCSDNIKNGNESDVDCGWYCARQPNGVACSGGFRCVTPGDCINGHPCMSGVCN